MGKFKICALGFLVIILTGCSTSAVVNPTVEKVCAMWSPDTYWSASYDERSRLYGKVVEEVFYTQSDPAVTKKFEDLLHAMNRTLLFEDAAQLFDANLDAVKKDASASENAVALAKLNRDEFLRVVDEEVRKVVSAAAVLCGPKK